MNPKICNECDLQFSTAEIFCNICGSDLILTSTPSTRTSNSNHVSTLDNRDITLGLQLPSSEAFFDLLGEDFRQAMEASINLSQNRSVSKEYLKSISKVEVDDRKGILYDIFLQVGSLSLLATIAGFGPAITVGDVIEGQLVMGDPEYGESDLSAIPPSCANPIICLKRGVVSFAKKAVRAQAAGAKALLVLQAAESNWPFVMTDSSNELLNVFNCTIDIPILMVGPDDASLIDTMLQSAATKSSTTFAPCSIRCGTCEVDCAVCQEPYQTKDTVMKLPCRHLYHASCLTSWLLKNSTCPLCRHQLPKVAKLEQQPLASEPVAAASTAMPYFA